MNRITTVLKRFWPLIILIGLELILFATNYTPGTYLIGWDNILPEFNFSLNLKRNLFAVWQEYRGMGLLDGMAHSANLVHTIFLYLLSLIFTQSLLRYIFTFLMHFLGGIGMYYLLKYLFSKKPITYHLSLITIVGSLFYLLNAFTIQMLYAPLEAFSVHFAALPWLSLTLCKYLKSGSRKSFFWFLLTGLLSTPQFFVTPLFLPIMIVLTISSLAFIKQYKRVLIGLMGFLIINSFWLLPYIYSIPQNAPIIASAKINQMSSAEIFSRNQAFGDLKNVLLLRSFSLDFVEINPEGISEFVMLPWRDHLNQSAIFALSVIFLILTLWGLITSLLVSLKQESQNHWIKFAFTLIFLIGLAMLGTDIPIVHHLTSFLRDNLPFFGEAFRFSFTKFGLMFAFAYSVLLTLGIRDIIQRVNKMKGVSLIVGSFLILLIVVYSWPSFTGKFFYPALKINLPQQYLSLFEYMRHQYPSGRTAMLPQSDFWSWKHYNFGLAGSGFTWYGLPQPTIDRAFDPWSTENENYYWELSFALYSKDWQMAEKVFEKYGIRYIIFDDSIRSSTHNRSLFTYETKQFLSQSPRIKLVKQFDNLSVYEFELPIADSFISIYQNLPIISPSYNWTDNDLAFQENGPYLSADSLQTMNYDLRTIYYPFRSLFTKRSVDEREFSVNESDSTITISALLDSQVQSWPIQEATNSAQLFKTDTEIGVVINKQEQLAYDSATEKSLSADAVNVCSKFRSGEAETEEQFGNGLSWLKFTDQNQRSCLSYGISRLEHRYGYLFVVKSRHISGQPLRFALINQTAKHTELETFLPKASDWNTSYFILPPLAQDGLGYDVYIINDSIGRHNTINDLASIKAYQIPYNYLVGLKLTHPNLNGFGDQSSKFEDQRSPNYELQSMNYELTSVSHPNPAEYWVTLSDKKQVISDKSEDTTLVLSQSYHEGWKAYKIKDHSSKFIDMIYKTFPYVFGEEIKNHVLVNNWANAWLLKEPKSADQTQQEPYTNSMEQANAKSRRRWNDSTSIYIIFLPQLLQFLGFILLPLPLLYLLLIRKQSSNKLDA